MDMTVSIVFVSSPAGSGLGRDSRLKDVGRDVEADDLPVRLGERAARGVQQRAAAERDNVPWSGTGRLESGSLAGAEPGLALLGEDCGD